MENLLQCKGKKFKANIHNIPVEGRIQVEKGSIYLCQDVSNGPITTFQIFVSGLRRKKRPNLSRIGR